MGQVDQARNSRSPASRHVAGVDLLRFLAAFSVMLFHLGFSWTLPGSTVFRATGGLARYPELLDAVNFGWIGVQIFFVISGFVIAYSAEGATLFSFVKSRINRLVPAAWICATLTFVAATFLHEDGMSLTQYRHSLFFLPWAPWVDPSYWTLGVEISFYASVAILIACHRFDSIAKLAAAIGLVSALYWLLYCISLASAEGSLLSTLYDGHQGRLRELALLHHGCFFGLGVYLWVYMRRALDARSIAIAAVLAAACIVQIAIQSASVSHKAGMDFSPVFPVLFWMVCMGFMAWSIRHNHVFHRYPWALGPLRRIGLMTYPLYLIHQVFGSLILGALIAGGMGRFAALGLTILTVVIVSGLISSGLEPPLRKLLDRGALRVRAYVHA